MKGPNLRLKHDLRRTWECPVCKRRERTAGTVTFLRCACQAKQPEGKPIVMKLVEDVATRQPRGGKMVEEAAPAGVAGVEPINDASVRKWEGEAPAEPTSNESLAQQELRPPNDTVLR